MQFKEDIQRILFHGLSNATLQNATIRILQLIRFKLVPQLSPLFDFINSDIWIQYFITHRYIEGLNLLLSKGGNIRKDDSLLELLKSTLSETLFHGMEKRVKSNCIQFISLMLNFDAHLQSVLLL